MYTIHLKESAEENLLQCIDIFLSRGPTGDETADSMMVVGLAEVRELHLTTQPLCLFVVDDDELLVSGGVYIEFKTSSFEDFLHPHGHLDGMFGKFEIKVVAKQRFKLQTNQRPFGNHSTVLLLDGEEMLVGLAVGEDHRLTAKGTNLRAANIEHVTVI